MIVDFTKAENFTVDMVVDAAFKCSFGNIIVSDYSGSYVVTPTQETQILPTGYKTLSQNIVVNPIPSNYGLITWNGSVLTVS